MPNIENAELLLSKYKKARTALTNRIVQNEQWYKLRHTAPVSEDNYIPASAWLFNSLAVKHADAMSSIPAPYVSAREPSDTESAETLSKLLPILLEYNDFPEVYSSVWNDKLKHGTGCYGVFWNPNASDGLGDIEIRRVDILNLFWEPGVNDLNESPNVFHIELRSKDMIMEMYPEIKELNTDTAQDTNRYLYDDDVDVSDKAAVVDWYYKRRNSEGKEVVHYCKYVGGYVLYCTEDLPEYKERGLYDHGRYPFVTDVMYKIEGTPCGFGSLDIMKDAQMQIDKLGYAILENARMAATRRYFIRADGSVNEQEFADWRRPFVHIQGAGLGEDSIREISVQPLSDIYLELINNKIAELKETSGNRDVTTGGTDGRVVAAAAIQALQESGSKMTSDMIASSYRAFCKVCHIMVELIRQFYTVPRCFRVVSPNDLDTSSKEYIVYENSGISGLKQTEESAGAEYVHHPVFDISIAAEKSVDSKRAELNSMAKELYNMGVFEPQNRESARLLIEMMDFEGRDELLSKLADAKKEETE
ncbi:MAG: hypothetical protein IJV70_03505 [Clostridia bacterium]|nr:hypothetical protein [Clostridia bacterium]